MNITSKTSDAQEFYPFHQLILFLAEFLTLLLYDELSSQIVNRVLVLRDGGLES